MEVNNTRTVPNKRTVEEFADIDTAEDRLPKNPRIASKVISIYDNEVTLAKLELEKAQQEYETIESEVISGEDDEIHLAQLKVELLKAKLDYHAKHLIYVKEK